MEGVDLTRAIFPLLILSTTFLCGMLIGCLWNSFVHKRYNEMDRKYLNDRLKVAEMAYAMAKEYSASIATKDCLESKMELLNDLRHSLTLGRM